jgi:hypothetical protein
MSAYIKSLEEYTRQYQIENQAKAHDPGSRLKDQVARWHAMLPPELRDRPYTMDMLLREFRASPMALGKALAELGWVRKRNWRGPGAYARYWLPPNFHRDEVY